MIPPALSPTTRLDGPDLTAYTWTHSCARVDMLDSRSVVASQRGTDTATAQHWFCRNENIDDRTNETKNKNGDGAVGGKPGVVFSRPIWLGSMVPARHAHATPRPGQICRCNEGNLCMSGISFETIAQQVLSRGPLAGTTTG